MGRGIGTVAIVLATCAAARADWFIAGDVDGSGSLDLNDAVVLLGDLFRGEAGAKDCLASADADGDGIVSINDAVYLLTRHFALGARPSSPIGGCWSAYPGASLGCSRFAPCGPVAVFLVLHRSGSMRGAPWKEVQQEAIDIIASLSDGDSFSLIFADSEVVMFPGNGEPLSATAANRAAGIRVGATTQCGIGICKKPALLAALSLAARSAARAKVVCYFSNGFSGCPGTDLQQYAEETLEAVGRANTTGLPIHAFCVAPDPDEGEKDEVRCIEEGWMQSLASQNGGSYVRVVTR
jgi:hypothetical protein